MGGGMGMGMPMGGGMGMGMPMGGGMGMPMGGGMGGGGMGNMQGGAFQAGFNGSLGAMGATQAAGLISLVTRIVDPGNWNRPPQLNQFQMMGMGMGMGMGMMGFPMMFPNPGMVGMVGMVGMMGNAGMIGAGPPPDPNAPSDPQLANSIDFFPPALALIVRAPSRMHTSITGGIVGGKAKRLEAAAMIEQENKNIAIAKANGRDPNIKVAPAQGVDNDPKALALKAKNNLDPTKVWNESFARGGVDAGLVIATADFLFESGEFKHAAELLKANLRHGVVVRPWVFESLAIALEASGGDPEEIRRARLSGIALDPNDAQGFMSAARAMADRGQFERALSFCKQAAQLEPNDYHPYEVALAYAESAKDASAMEWAVGQLVSQDWPVDNLFIQKSAKERLVSLAGKLKVENRGKEANQLEAALQRLNQRDLIVQLVWDNAAGTLSELEMKIKEPCGSVCSLDQKQTPGGGIMIGYNLTDKEPNSQYIVSQAFAGEYEITVSRVYGQPLGNRARLLITQNAGTKDQSRRIEIIKLDNNLPVKINLKEGRRTDLATVSPAARERHTQQGSAAKGGSAFDDLRSVANPNYFGAIGSGPRGGAGAPNQLPSALAAKDSKNQVPMAPIAQNAINPTGGGVQMTTQVRMSADQRSMDMVIRPFFDMANRANRPAVNLSGIPGGGN
jgi:tetratricopeptide (TPR) repeat protein